MLMDLFRKILMITPFHKAQRGNSITAVRLSCGLAERGYDINLLSLDQEKWREQLGTLLDQSEYGLLHVLHARHLGLILKSFPQAAQLPIILTTTGTDIHFDLHNEQRATVLHALQAATKIVVFHDDLQELVAQEYPPAANKMITIPQGVSIPRNIPGHRRDWGFGPDEVIFLLPSGLRPVKNISLAIDALTPLQPFFPRLRLVITGADLDSDYSRPLLARIQTLPWVSYLGEVPHEIIGSLLALGDVVLNTSLAEGQPQAVLEGMSLGLPSIMTAVPGNLNIITNGKEGFYVEDETNLCWAAQQLLEDESLRREMGSRAQALVSSKYRLEQELDAYDTLYCSLLSAQP